LCRDCRHHFVFNISGFRGCGSHDVQHPEHHFVVDGQIESFPLPDIQSRGNSRFYPVICSASYQCSACVEHVTLRISAPRLPQEWVDFLASEDRIRKNLEAAKQSDPVRYNLTKDQIDRYLTGVFDTLNQYLTDVLESPSERKISARNKTFTVQFGESCEDIFRYLGFEIDKKQDDDEEYFLRPPRLPPAEVKTLVGTERAFFQDAKSEVQSILYKQQNQNNRVVKVAAPPPVHSLEKALGVAHIGPRPLHSRDRMSASELADFWLLGASAEANDNVLKWAYSRQALTDPPRREQYLESLARLASSRSEDLQLFVIHEQTEASRVEPKSGVDHSFKKAYDHFNLDPSGDEPSSYFINVYRTFCVQSPLQRAEHRKQLLRIGKHRHNDEAILKVVYTEAMDVDEACALLAIEPGYPPDIVAALAHALIKVCPFSSNVTSGS
jgi:ubiquitin carboxyl-terminal hydrolase 25/28